MNQLSIVDVIQKGAEVAAPRATSLPCPFCGADPLLAVRRAGRFLVGCEAEDCFANPQVEASAPEIAWLKWNRRKA